jgi:hypothetical protein
VADHLGQSAKGSGFRRYPAPDQVPHARASPRRGGNRGLAGCGRLGGCSVDSGVRRLMASRYLFADDGHDDRNADKRESSAEGALTHGRPYGGMSHLARLGTLALARSAPGSRILTMWESPAVWGAWQTAGDSSRTGNPRRAGPTDTGGCPCSQYSPNPTKDQGNWGPSSCPSHDVGPFPVATDRIDRTYWEICDNPPCGVQKRRQAG